MPSDQVLQHPGGNLFGFVRSNIFKGLLSVGVSAAAGFFLLALYLVFSIYFVGAEQSRTKSLQTSQVIFEALNCHLQEVVGITSDLVQTLSGEDLTQEVIESKLHWVANNHRQLRGCLDLGLPSNILREVGYVFQLDKVISHNFSDDGILLHFYSPYIHTQKHWLEIDYIDRDYNYVNPASDEASWFLEAMQNGEAWSELENDHAFNRSIIRYARVMEDIGIAFANIDLQWIREIIDSHDLGIDNYAMLLDREGHVLYDGLGAHTSEDSIAALAVRSPNDQVISTALRILSSDTKIGAEDETMGVVNTFSGRGVWMHAFSIPETGWLLITVSHKDNVPSHTLFIGLICSLVAVVVGIYLLTLSKLTAYVRHVVFVSLSLSGATFIICLLQQVLVTDIENEHLVMNHADDIDDFIETRSLAAIKNQSVMYTYIPTAIFIQSLEFETAINVRLSGYVSLRFADLDYAERYLREAKNAIVFPEAISTELSLAYDRMEDGDRLVGYYFETTLRQNFDYRKYPLDSQLVWIRIWPQPDAPVVLIPDIEAYRTINPRELPGIERDFVVTDWELVRTFFQLVRKEYNTNIRSEHFVDELFFNIELKRKFFNPFIAHFFPLLVVLLMLFIITLGITGVDARKNRLGFDTSNVVASASALFFVVLIAHVQLRGALAASTLVYLDYYYLTTYLVILLLTGNAVAFAMNLPWALVQVEDNLIPKLIYWPGLLLFILIVTAFVFWEEGEFTKAIGLG